MTLVQDPGWPKEVLYDQQTPTSAPSHPICYTLKIELQLKRDSSSIKIYCYMKISRIYSDEKSRKSANVSCSPLWLSLSKSRGLAIAKWHLTSCCLYDNMSLLRKGLTDELRPERPSQHNSLSRKQIQTYLETEKIARVFPGTNDNVNADFSLFSFCQ